MGLFVAAFGVAINWPLTARNAVFLVGQFTLLFVLGVALGRKERNRQKSAQ